MPNDPTLVPTEALALLRVLQGKDLAIGEQRKTLVAKLRTLARCPHLYVTTKRGPGYLIKHCDDCGVAVEG